MRCFFVTSSLPFSAGPLNRLNPLNFLARCANFCSSARLLATCPSLLSLPRLLARYAPARINDKSLGCNKPSSPPSGRIARGLRMSLTNTPSRCPGVINRTPDKRTSSRGTLGAARARIPASRLFLSSSRLSRTGFCLGERAASTSGPSFTS